MDLETGNGFNRAETFFCFETGGRIMSDHCCPAFKQYFLLLDYLNKEHCEVALEWWAHLEAQK